MKTITAKLPPDLDAWLAAEARQRRTTKSTIVRESLQAIRNVTGKHTAVSFYDMTKDLLGCFDGPSDLATNPKYMKHYGK